MKTSQNLRSGFSLTEMLVVMAVIGMVIGLAVPSLDPLLKGNKITAAAEEFRFHMSEHRAKVVSENNPIEVRFLFFSDPSLPDAKPAWRAYQFGRFKTETSGESPKFTFDPISEIFRLPDGVIISEDVLYSSLVDESKISRGVHDFPMDGVSNVQYTSFTIRPDSSTNLPKKAGSVWFITFVLENTVTTGLPKNFITATVDPFNSTTKLYQR